MAFASGFTRGMSPTYRRLLESRGLRLRPGSRIAGTHERGIKMAVVDKATGEDRGERWIRRTGEHWEVLREAPRNVRSGG